MNISNDEKFCETINLTLDICKFNTISAKELSPAQALSMVLSEALCRSTFLLASCPSGNMLKRFDIFQIWR